MLRQVCQVLLKYSREAGRDKKMHCVDDIKAKFQNKYVITFFSFKFYLSKIRECDVATLQILVQQHQGGYNPAVSVQQHQGYLLSTHGELHGKDDCCSEAKDFWRGCLWDFLPSCLWDLCLTALGRMPCCLGELCHAALGKNALLPLGILSYAAQRRDYNLAPQKRINQLGSQVQDYSAWLPEENCSVWLLVNSAWHSGRGLSTTQLSYPNNTQSKYIKFKTETQLFSLGECYSRICCLT